MDLYLSAITATNDHFIHDLLYLVKLSCLHVFPGQLITAATDEVTLHYSVLCKVCQYSH